MTPRFHLLTVHAQHIAEGCILGAVAVWQSVETLLAVLTQEDWKMLFGPHGLAVGAILALIVVWQSNVAKEKREEKARERRHQEALAAGDLRNRELLDQIKSNAADNKVLTEELKELTAEGIKAQMKNIAATNSMDNSIKSLTIELKERPCQKIKLLQDDA